MIKVVARGQHFNIVYNSEKKHYLYSGVKWPASSARFNDLATALKFSSWVKI